MGEATHKLAIPVFRSRVAPVFNWCSRMLIFSEGAAIGGIGQEIVLLNMTALERLRMLQVEGVETLICGALSPELLCYGEHLGLHIICGVAGDIDEVCWAFHAKQLSQPRFWLPGCLKQRHRRQGLSRAETNGAGRERGARNCGDQAQARSGGACLCPHCGTRIPYQPGIPCSQNPCPNCHQPMLREEL
jgi:hypothetical protein